MVGLIILASIAQAADLLTFAPAVARWGSLGEVNPVMAAAYDYAGIWGAAALKGAALLFVVLVIYAIEGAGGPPWVGVAILLFATLVGTIGTATNVWALSL